MTRHDPTAAGSSAATTAAERRPPYRTGRELGRRGEEAAARHLEARGYRVLERGFRTRAGEIDIVAEDRGTLVFVEVKARSSLACGYPSEAVGWRKRVHLLRAAALYLLGHGGADRPCRFDVVEVVEDGGGGVRIGLIQDAFEAP
jgi:putative endonuclease